MSGVALTRTSLDHARPSVRRPARSGWLRFLPWVAMATAFVLLPYVFPSDSSIAMMCICAIAVVFALSYNMLLGQTGLLSFGHAIFYGLGGFIAIHTMNLAADRGWPLPLPLIPLVGGFAGLLFGILFGSLASKRGGTVFAMITFGLGELVSSVAPILNRFFGGEQGITTDRSGLPQVLGWSFGPQIQVYYLIAAWCFVSIAAIYYLRQTPFGQISRAVRENPDRIEYIGYSMRWVRFTAFALAAFFAGIAGGLAAINYEIMTVANVGAQQSTMVVLMTYIGGTGFFLGPVIGAILISIMQISLSDVTAGWQLYLGLLFMVIVMFSPGGIAGLLFSRAPGESWRERFAPHRLALGLPILLATAGAIVLIELGYQAGLKSQEGPIRTIFGLALNAQSPLSWACGLMALAIGLVVLRAGAAASDREQA